MPAEKEAAQKRIDANLAGASNFGKKGDDACAKLAQVAGEFMTARQVLEFSAAQEDVESKFRQREKQLIKLAADQRRCLLGVEAGVGMKRREQGTNWKLDFFFRKPAAYSAKGVTLSSLVNRI